MAEEKQYNEEVSSAQASTVHRHQQNPHSTNDEWLHHDHIAEEAIGGHTADLGKSYFTSLNFIGTVIVSLISASTVP